MRIANITVSVSTGKRPSGRRGARPSAANEVLRSIALPLALAGLLLAGCGGGGDAAAGQRLYNQQSLGRTDAPGCVTCHSVEPGEVSVGPSHAGLAGRAAERVQSPDYSGQATTAEEYLRESIVEPNAYVVPGFAENVMFQRYAAVLTPAQIDDLVAYLLTLE